MTVDLPLRALRVVSLAEQYPGPYATLILADLGADVILVERPNGGDPSRKFPHFFEALNRNKRSVTVDLKAVDGRHQLTRLIETADIFIEGYRPGVIERLGFGYEAVRTINPRTIYVSISGFGQDGPYRDRPAHDLSYQGTAGLLHEQGTSLKIEDPPSLPVGDLTSGTFAAVACLAGIVSRQRTGTGSYYDVSVVDTLLSWMTTQVVPVLNRTGVAGIPREPGYRNYQTSDGKLLALSIAHEDNFWDAMCQIIGLDATGLKSDERLARLEELESRIAGVLATRAYDEWAVALDVAGVPFGPIHTLKSVVSDPHLQARGMFVTVPATIDHPERVHLRQPLKVDGSGGMIARHSPGLGEHTKEVFAELDSRRGASS
jgi:crotonobetainyl-CoA:carnitine CoA-transferase CaiB-like acyl-CoA transferase